MSNKRPAKDLRSAQKSDHLPTPETDHDIDAGSGRAAVGDDGPANDCRNCGEQVGGKYCSNCGQSLRIHRSVSAFWHDILHGVLHFEGQLWQTLPKLAWHPGELTHRYIHGQRARYISPIALFLFSVFLMFAIFSVIGTPFSSGDSAANRQLPQVGAAADVQSSDPSVNVVQDAKLIDLRIAEKMARSGTATGAEKQQLAQEILAMKRGRNIVAYLAGEPRPYLDAPAPDAGIDPNKLSRRDLDAIRSGIEDISDDELFSANSGITTGSPKADAWLKIMIAKVQDNPDLLLYKVKANGYKFAWLLIPLSLPFVWLSLIGKRGLRLYDLAIFTTYSLSFTLLLFIFCAILSALGITSALWLFIIYPPFHMYRQLRGTFELSHGETLVRLFFLLIFSAIAALSFLGILLVLGALG